jgi:hypothetical protein
MIIFNVDITLIFHKRCINSNLTLYYFSESHHMMIDDAYKVLRTGPGVDLVVENTGIIDKVPPAYKPI